MNLDGMTIDFVVVKDRYAGSYSGGGPGAEWIAGRNVDRERLHLLEGGASGDDSEAQGFWLALYSWVAFGSSPEGAIAAVRAKGGW